MPFPLDRYDSLLRAMGALGWSYQETLGTDVAIVASWLGHGVQGESWDYDPVIRGSRSLHLPKTDTDTPDAQNAQEHVQSVQGDARREAYRKAREGT